MDGDRARLTSLSALLGNANLTFALAHVIAAALLTGGFFMAGVSAWHFWRRTADVEFFRRSLRTGLVAAAIGSFLVIGVGYAQFEPITRNQPTKLVDGGRLAEAQAQMVAQYGPGDYAPPSWTLGAFDWMTTSGNLLFLIAVAGLVLTIRDWLVRVRRLRFMLVVLIATVPVPFLTAIDGWLVREVGRQPWAVYGVLKTSDAVSDRRPGPMLASLVGFGALLIGLALLDWWLIARHARRGPGDEFLLDAAS
jgi:cytochrome bd ubiquinol oxidase subunit I